MEYILREVSFFEPYLPKATNSLHNAFHQTCLLSCSLFKRMSLHDNVINCTALVDYIPSELRSFVIIGAAAICITMRIPQPEVS